MQCREGRGAAGRRYFETRAEGGDRRVYRVWQPPGEDGEGERAQGTFFIGKSGRWYECVDKTIERFPNSVQFAYERTEAASAREANDPVSQATIALEANRAIMRVNDALRREDEKESKQMGERFDIGRAVNEMKHHGMRARRGAWPEGSFVVYQKGYPEGIPINENTANATGIKKGTVCRFLPYLMCYHVERGAFAPWIAGNGDLLAEDWELVT